MVWINLRDRLGWKRLDKPLIIWGKIILILATITLFLGGLVDIIQGLNYFFKGESSLAPLLVAVLFGAIRITLAYGGYLLLATNESGLLVSIVRFLAQFLSGMYIILSQVMIIAGVAMLVINPPASAILIPFGGFLLFTGLGVIFFIDERDKIQAAQAALQLAS